MHVQGESLKTCAASLVVGFLTPRSPETGVKMMDFAELMAQVIYESEKNPSETLYIWINFDNNSDSWAIDTDKDSLVEPPTFFYKRG